MDKTKTIHEHEANQSGENGLDKSSKKFNPKAPTFVPQTSGESKVSSERASSSKATRPKKHEIAESGVPSPCVWVGNVSPDISEADFRAEFERFGTVLLVRMFPRSKCAFVTYKKPQHALDSLSLEGKLIGSMRLTLNLGMASRHLWVGNVDSSVTEDSLRDLFVKFGPVESVRILHGNRSAFVNYLYETDAFRAAEELNCYALCGQELVINFQWPETHRRVSHKTNVSRRASQPSPQNRVAAAAATASFFPNAPYPMPLYPSMPGYSSPLAMGAVPLSVPPEMIPSHYSLSLQLAPTPRAVKEPSAPSRQLFVGNLPPYIHEEYLFALFSRFGEVERVRAFPERGYGFVVYRLIGDATFARDQLIKYPPLIGDRALVINFGKSSRENARRHSSASVGSHSTMSDSLPSPVSQSSPISSPDTSPHNSPNVRPRAPHEAPPTLQRESSGPDSGENHHERRAADERVSQSRALRVGDSNNGASSSSSTASNGAFANGFANPTMVST